MASNVMALKKFLEKDSSRPVTMAEVKEFKEACTKEEFAEYCDQAAAALKE